MKSKIQTLKADIVVDLQAIAEIYIALKRFLDSL